MAGGPTREGEVTDGGHRADPGSGGFRVVRGRGHADRKAERGSQTQQMSPSPASQALRQEDHDKQSSNAASPADARSTNLSSR